MNTSNFEWPVDKKPLYSLLSIRLRGLIDGIPHQISNLANASALLGDALLNINWVGFYLMREGRLVLGPFQGKPACIEIEIGKGVCGTAVANDQVMLVKDVHQFPGHIACDSASNSEIVIPFIKEMKSLAFWISTAMFSPVLMKKIRKGWNTLSESWNLFLTDKLFFQIAYNHLSCISM